jgi:transposase-like protein
MLRACCYVDNSHALGCIRGRALWCLHVPGRRIGAVPYRDVCRLHRLPHHSYQVFPQVGTVELKVPRVREGGYFPSLLESRKKTERALSAVVQEAYVHGVSTRKVDVLVKALGMGGIPKSLMSPSCAKSSTSSSSVSGAGRSKALSPYMWVDATYVKACQDGHVASVAVVLAVGATIRSVFAQPDAKSANQQWIRVSEGFRHRFSRLWAENAVALREKPLAQVAPHKCCP